MKEKRKNVLWISMLISFFLFAQASLAVAQTEQKVANKLTLSVLQTKLAVCRLESHAAIPSWVHAKSEFLSITRTKDELSIVCDKNIVPQNVKSVTSWSAFRIEGPLDFNLIGILSSLLDPLAKGGVSVFTVSTFDTDYILVKEQNLQKAIAILQNQCIIKKA